MPVVRRSTAPTFSAPHGGATFIGLAAPSRGSKETSAWQVTLPPHEPGLEHSLDHEEVFVVLSGRLEVTLDGDTHEVGAGDAIIAPAHQTLSLANPFDEPASAVAILPVGARGRIGDGEPFTPPWAA